MPHPTASAPPVVVRPTADGRCWPEVGLRHGESPAAAVARSLGHPVGVVLHRSAELVDGVIVLTLEVQPGGTQPAPDPPPTAEPGVRFRRVASYAVVRDRDRVLMTELASDTPAPGTWTLPGGGLDPGESPGQAVLREVLEETAHELVGPRLIHVDSWRFTGRSPAGRLEDFHGIGLIYAASVAAVRDPEVLDVGGSTAAAAWVPLADLPDLPLGRRRAWLLQVLGVPPRPQA